MQNSTALNLVPKIVSLLQPLSPEDRKKCLSAAMIFLGAEPPNPAASIETSETRVGTSLQARAWIKKNGLSIDQLEEVFAFSEEGVETIASAIPGKGQRQQTVQAYMICGVQHFLQAGDTGFSDQEARELCKRFGCYDRTNHAKYMKDFRNWIIGNPKGGWRLTNPGLTEAVHLIKQLTEKPVA